MLEISLVRRDADGNPIGRRFYRCKNGAEMLQRWTENQTLRKPKKKKKNKEKIPSRQEAEKILKNIFNNIKNKETQEIVND